LVKKNGIYEGYFKDASKHGNGMMITSNGDVFHGTWDQGRITGSGKLETEEFIYEGQI